MGKFVLLAVAEAVVDEVNMLLTSSRPRLLYLGQLEDSAGSISSNIREGLGRRAGPERNQFYRYARGSAEETDDRLTRNFVAKRLKPTTYWRLHNRLVLIITTINRILGEDRRSKGRDKRRDKGRDEQRDKPRDEQRDEQRDEPQ